MNRTKRTLFDLSGESDSDSAEFFAQLNSSSSSDNSDSDETVYYKHGKNPHSSPRHSSPRRSSPRHSSPRRSSPTRHDDHKNKHSPRHDNKNKNSHRSSPREHEKHVSKNECVQVDIADLEASIDLLNKNLDSRIEQIPRSDPVHLAYENVKLFVSMFYGRPEYPKIVEILGKYTRPGTIVPGTIGGFLYGCALDSYGDVTKLCSPICLNSVLPDGSSESFCPYQVWMMNEKSLEPLTDSLSDKAYVFANDFNGQTINTQTVNTQLKFTPHQINLLKQRGIKQIQVLITDRNTGRHSTIIQLTELENLPIVGHDALNSPPIVIKQINNVSSVNMGRFWSILVLIILVAIAIWLIFKYVIPRRG